MRLAFALWVSALASAANAADLLSVSVERDSGIYTLDSEVRFDATVEQLYDTMNDWGLSTQFSSVVVESRNLPPDETGRRGYYARNRFCFLVFCRSFERRGYVQAEPHEKIRAVADPEQSDFHISDETWLFRRDGDQTILTYKLRMQPKFWVPPVIGPYFIKRKLETNGVEALLRIESVAQRQVVASE